MRKVNFENLKNLNTPQNFIDNAINIPAQAKKPLPFVVKHSRTIAAVAALVLVCTVSLTVYFTQDRITPPVDPDYTETQKSTASTSAVNEQESTATQTETKEEQTSSQSTNGNEPFESQSGATTPTTSNIVTMPTSSQTNLSTQSSSGQPQSSKPSGGRLDSGVPVKPNSVPNSKPTTSPNTEPTEKPVVNPTQAPTTKPTVKPTQAPETEPTETQTIAPTSAPETEPTEPPIVTPTQRPTSAPAKLSLPTIPPREPQPTQPIASEPVTVAPTVTPTAKPTVGEFDTFPPPVDPTMPPECTEPSEPIMPSEPMEGVPATETPPNVDPQGLYIKADGTTYKVEQGGVYQYTFYLTVPSVKIGGMVASTFYDEQGLEVIIPKTKYGYDDLNAVFPIFGEFTTANLRGLKGELCYVYASINGLRLNTVDCVAMTISFKVTASSGVYEINTFIKELSDTDINKYVWNNEIINDNFSTRFELSTPSETPTQKPTSPSQDEPEYDIDLIPLHHCPLETVACVGHTDEFNLTDEIYCSVYDKKLNLIGNEDYYSAHRIAQAYDLDDSTTEFVYYPSTNNYITEVGSYFYCFYNTQGDILYWAKLMVY